MDLRGRGLLSAFVFFGFITTVIAKDRDPVGEHAFYTIVKDKSRTSSMVKSGELSAEVLGPNDNSKEPGYTVEIKYKLKVNLVGTQQGTRNMDFPAEYFTEQFIKDLRANGSYQSDQLKIKHVGYADATTINGDHYDNCDKIVIYDIDVQNFRFFRNMLKQVALAELEKSGKSFSRKAEITDLVVKADIEYGIPVLGAVKLDVSGKYQGMSIKAGADYDPSR